MHGLPPASLRRHVRRAGLTSALAIAVLLAAAPGLRAGEEEDPVPESLTVAPAPPPAPVVIAPAPWSADIPAPALLPSDLAPLLAGRVEAALPAALASSRLPASVRESIQAAYAGRGHAPFWLSGEGFSQPGRRLRLQLGAAAEDGLRAADYAVAATGETPLHWAERDIELTIAAVRFARDARGGRLNPRSLSKLITPELELPDAAEVLAGLAAAPDAAAALAAYLPQHEGYRRLKAELAAVRAAAASVPAVVRIPPGRALRTGQRDPRIPLLRQRLGLEAGLDDPVFDEVLSEALRAFQSREGLAPDGVLGPRSVAALNRDLPGMREADIVANMERWRWLPSDLGSEHVIVNVPEFVVRKVEAGRIVHQARAIVGTADRPTPIFSHRMDHLVLNPSWTVPPTILREDYLPKLAVDPGYAERKGLQVIRQGNRITLRQPPGPTNALGNIKFMFPNSHAVYLHDTPSRGLFARDARAFSSGCVRVEEPFRLAELVLGAASGWTENRLRRLIGSGERTIRLDRPLPIHLVYLTSTIDADGRLAHHDDIYGFHALVKTALGLPT